jgi:hypothetical protein
MAIHIYTYHLYGLAVRVPGYKPRGLGFDFRHFQMFWVVVGLDQRDFLKQNVEAPAYKTDINGWPPNMQKLELKFGWLAVVDQSA